MTIWQLHMLNARGALTPIMAEIRAHAREMLSLTSEHLDLPRFDLVVRASRDVPPDWAITGRAPCPGLIEITLDPARIEPEHFRRTLLRALHNLARWDGPGHGMSLGESLVWEGLAGHFVQQVVGGPADPWDQTRPASGVLKQAGSLWARRDHDHGEWFLGRGKMRKWTGYGLGHRIVGAYLDEVEGQDAASLTLAPADLFRPALRRLMSVDGIEDDSADEAIAPPEHAPDHAPDQPACATPDGPCADTESEAPIASRDAGGQTPRTPQDN